MIGCWCDKRFVAKVDAARGVLSRSQFCRDALREKLERLGMPISVVITNAPDRSGKGRRPARRTGYPGPAGPFVLNEPPEPGSDQAGATPAAARRRGAKKLGQAEKKRG